MALLVDLNEEVLERARRQIKESLRLQFLWQTLYNFKQPVAIPKGTRFMVTAYLDNSDRNKNNPDPARAVRYGEPTCDEMVASFIEYTADGQ
jgi:hypothetical protein